MKACVPKIIIVVKTLKYNERLPYIIKYYFIPHIPMILSLQDRVSALGQVVAKLACLVPSAKKLHPKNGRGECERKEEEERFERWADGRRILYCLNAWRWRKKGDISAES